ncbi:unnamed protein product [Anisakis simplex]|uniref:Cht7 (inferred by orthology to a D. melanogaster protein) n=1 Tax=Anisakis simplex TaxID=6269 RepID=A0A0M3K0H6_ANISI|nr:unnamed protein product [Anisakis simplex]
MKKQFVLRAHHPDDTEPGSGGYALVNSLKSRDSKLKTILSIGGKVFGTERFKDMSSSERRRATFINSAIEFVRRYGFDGIDIDWYLPEGQADKDNFSALLRELRAAIEQEASTTGHKRLILTADVAPEKRRIENGYDVHKIEEYLDFVMVMSYDFHGPWEQRTGFNSPLYSQDGLSVHDAATSWESQGMRNCKIVIGIPLYGRGWTLSNSSNTDVGAAGTPSRPTRYICESGVASYYEIREMLASGAQNRWNDEQQVPYLVQDDQWFSYDDEKSVTKKVRYCDGTGISSICQSYRIFESCQSIPNLGYICCCSGQLCNSANRLISSSLPLPMIASFFIILLYRFHA